MVDTTDSNSLGSNAVDAEYMTGDVPNSPNPQRPAEPGRLYYVPKAIHTATPMALHVAARVTAHCVVPWCDAFRVRALYHDPGGGPMVYWPGKTGTLPHDVAAKHAALEELFAWLEQTRGRPDAAITLTNGGADVLYDDGGRFLLALRPAEFEQVQDCWERHGLPRDLCFLPVPGSDEGNRLPWDGDPAEQQRAFLDACGQFLRALSLRAAELADPGVVPDFDERELLDALDAALGSVVLYELGFARKAGAAPGE